MYASETQLFLLSKKDDTAVKGYFLSPANSSSPIIFAIQGSACESAFRWFATLIDLARSLGLGLVVLEKQGISRDDVNLFVYHQNNCLKNRYQDYIFCLENMSLFIPNWTGSVIFLGESEGGLLAANLASHTLKTVAVLLFATGGGMSHREEVEYAIQKRLEAHGASQEEFYQYMLSLNAQLDNMIYDPSPHKQFLGNSYKWWASLLSANKASTFLCQLSCPIYLVHGTQDHNIPVHSADLTVKILQKAQKPFTYLRLEGYDHNLDHTEILTATHQWLQAILSGQEPKNESLNRSIFHSVSSSFDWETDIAQYIFSRGGRAEVKGGRDIEGNEYVKGDLSVSRDREGGGRWEAGLEAKGSRDCEGNTKGSVEVRGGIEWD